MIVKLIQEADPLWNVRKDVGFSKQFGEKVVKKEYIQV